jgi:hypothetical protein
MVVEGEGLGAGVGRIVEGRSLVSVGSGQLGKFPAGSGEKSGWVASPTS